MSKRFIEVAAALIKENNRVFLCLRNPGDHYGNLWEFPGGKIEDGETPAQAIVRELKEEVGVTAKAGRVVARFFDEDPSLIIKVFLVRCRIISGEPRPLDCRDLGFFSSQEIKKLRLAPVDKKIFRKIL
jgi:8-oxo-dGTP diphosphatase